MTVKIFRPFSANLLEIQTDLMNSFMESSLNYCQQLAMTGLQSQIEMMARFEHLLTGNAKERAEKAFSKF
ncbi:hypothetical protein [Polaromonas sp.]|uniref:hypothetical protein n=1 Tax=Polaromonas sp. TaxID=1869339 RepID=UPI0013BB0326|nr:hypothetical protein [Polaromonas sp.]NDP61153.1 hypothetical protein [Polaromonas sp.]